MKRKICILLSMIGLFALSACDNAEEASVMTTELSATETTTAITTTAATSPSETEAVTASPAIHGKAFPWENKVFEHDWQNAYAAYFSSLKGTPNSVFAGDLSGDDIPEIVIWYRDTDTVEVLSYGNGAVNADEFAMKTGHFRSSGQLYYIESTRQLMYIDFAGFPPITEATVEANIYILDLTDEGYKPTTVFSRAQGVYDSNPDDKILGQAYINGEEVSDEDFAAAVDAIYALEPAGFPSSVTNSSVFDSLFEEKYKNGFLPNTVHYLNDTLFTPRVAPWEGGEFEHEWQRAYAEYLTENFYYYFPNGKVSIFDLQGDGIPEVYTGGVMLYYNENGLQLIEQWGGMGREMRYNEDTGQIMTYDSSSGVIDIKIYDYIDGKYEPTSTLYCEKHYDGSLAWTYYINGAAVGTFIDPEWAAEWWGYMGLTPADIRSEWFNDPDWWAQNDIDENTYFNEDLCYGIDEEWREKEDGFIIIYSINEDPPFAFPFTSFADVNGEWNIFFDENLFNTEGNP